MVGILACLVLQDRMVLELAQKVGTHRGQRDEPPVRSFERRSQQAQKALGRFRGYSRTVPPSDRWSAAPWLRAAWPPLSDPELGSAVLDRPPGLALPPSAAR